MKITPTRIADVYTIDPVVHGDERGFFMETWRESLFAAAGIEAPFVQDAMSQSARGVLRGMHYQIQQPQGTLVRVVAGEVFDVAVDLRRASPTFGRWVSETLSAANKRALWIPPGFAHGFYVMSEVAALQYKFTGYYAPQHERSLRWDDPQVGIRWPIHPGTMPILLPRDAEAATLGAADCYP